MEKVPLFLALFEEAWKPEVITPEQHECQTTVIFLNKEKCDIAPGKLLIHTCCY